MHDAANLHIGAQPLAKFEQSCLDRECVGLDDEDIGAARAELDRERIGDAEMIARQYERPGRQPASHAGQYRFALRAHDQPGRVTDDVGLCSHPG